MRLHLLYYRIFRYEYWPWWFFYIPIIPYWIYLAVRVRSFSFFTATNPGIDMGGFFGESKADILSGIQSVYLPNQLVLAPDQHGSVANLISRSGLDFPLIAKPDIGERGASVAKIHDLRGLITYLKHMDSVKVILQEFIDFEEEFGVLYSRLPNEKNGIISSITHKVFLSVLGDGNSTVRELMLQSVRARFQLNRFHTEQPELMNVVLPNGKKLILEPIGNHCRGTEFVNANELISDKLTAVFDRISIPIEGFFYGRFDLKAKSFEAFKEGKDLKIMELNGVSSEPGHIYATSMTLFGAYRDVAAHWKRVAEIAVINRQRGIAPVGLIRIMQRYCTHVLLKKRPSTL